MSERRVLVIGLDGATWDVLRPWMADGTLPHLAALDARGVAGDLESTLPPLTPPAWATFLTGKDPGKHGVFHFARLTSGTLDLAAGTPDLVDSRDIDGATLWDIAGHHGRHVVTINVPMSYPPRPVHGVMITCLLTPSDAPVFTHPPELSELLPGYRIDLDRFIDDKPFAADEEGQKPRREVEPTVELTREFQEMEEIRGRTALDLLRTEPWELFTVVFTAPDRMGHYLWPFHDPAPDADPTARAIHDGIVAVYRTIDDAIGRLVAAAGPECHVVVVSDHGMGATHSANVHWNSWLHARGLLKVTAPTAASPDAMLLRLRLPRDRVGRWVRRIPGLRSSRAVARARAARTLQPDLERSDAVYVRLFDPLGGIRINAPSPRREAIVEELVPAIAALRDPATGRPLVRRVFRRDEAFHGPSAHLMPDVLLMMDPAYGSSDRISSYSSHLTQRTVTGDSGAHRPEGIVLLAGPEIRSGADLHGARIADIAPTVLHLLDLPIPEDMDGCALRGAIRPEVDADRPPRQGPSLPRWPSDAAADAANAAWTDTDDRRVRERLRDLGYVE